MAIKNNGMISRYNLKQIFNEMPNERIIYVCAPAGYGKTVAVKQWLDGDIRARAVIPLDEYDNNPNLFCERFCDALAACQPNNATLSKIVSHSAFNSAPDEFALKAIAALSVRKRSVFVLDDLHFIDNEKVLYLIKIFLMRLPENFQIILISRNNIPPSFSDLWVKGRLARITADQLLFSKEEILSLYKKRGSAITLEEADNICRFTGGWAIGVNALLLSGKEPSGESFDYLGNFIRNSVWEKWDEATREFMLQTSVAQELHLSLCIALTGNADSEKLLNDLISSGAFIFQSSNGVYHYHHLFQIFLQNMLKECGDGYLFSLLEKEGEWHLAQQDFYSAANCFIRCKNHDGIAKCFDLLEFSDRNDFVIERMLPIIKNPEIRVAADKYPFLFYMLAWAAFAEGDVQNITAYMDNYYARFPEIVTRTPARAYNILFMRLMDFRISLHSFKQDIASLPVVPESEGGKGSITMNMPMLHRCTRDFSELAGENTEANITEIAAMIGWLFGEEAKLLIATLTAGLLYEQGHLEKAHMYALAANAEIKKHFAPESNFCAVSTLVNILDALGQKNEAEKSIKILDSMIEQNSSYYLNPNSNALVARRKFNNGDVKAAREWLAAHDTELYDNITFHDIYVAFVTSRAYISVGEYDSAIIMLAKVIELSTAYNRPMDIIEAQILLSIAYWKKKRTYQSEAMRHLDTAVSLAYKYNYVQTFINEGAELTGMLRRLQKSAEQKRSTEDKPSASFIKLLYLNTLEHKNTGLTSGQPDHSEKYTAKQKTVMKLLCEGKSYREIAEIMGVKLPTLRSHIALVYKKLDVTNKIDAIAKIKSSQIIVWNGLEDKP